ncbi:hypothetical protein HRbin41_00729 [bacterium HR41]|nr:hypothetical protein HRbin41_00729 [bacterium HR41]
MGLVNDRDGVVCDQSRLPVACAGARAEATEEEARAPHQRSCRYHLAHGGIEPPAVLAVDPASEPPDEQGSLHGRGTRGHPLPQCECDLAERSVRLRLERAGERGSESKRPLVLVVDQNSPRRDENQAARRAPLEPAREVLGVEEDVHVDDARFAGTRGGDYVARPTAAARDVFGEHRLPGVGIGAVEGAEETSEAFPESAGRGDVAHVALPLGSRSPPPTCRALPSARNPPGSGARAPRSTTQSTATISSPSRAL